MWIEICLLFLAVGYCFHAWVSSYWKRRGVFQVDGSFLFGNIKDVLFVKKGIHDVLRDIYEKHKERKLVGIYSFYKPILIVTDPAVMRQVMVSDFNSFSGSAVDIDMKTDPMMAMNPFSTHDLELWKERRGLHVSMLTPLKLKTMPELLIRVGRNMINFITEKENGLVKIKELSDLLAIDSVCTFSLGCEPTAFTDPENKFRKYAYKNLLSPDAGRAMNGYKLYPKLAKLFRYRIVSEESEKFLISICKQMMEFRRKNPSNRTDFFEHMAKANAKLTQEGKPGFTDIELAAHCFTVYVDSLFTTSSGFSYLVIELAKNPDFQEKLRLQILNSGKEIGEFDYDKINSIPLLQMAMTESLRIHPPALVAGRTCVKTTQLEGVTVEKGTRILLPFFAFHKDVQYFPEPEKFNPERFLSEENIVKGTVLPFGDGPRMCLGFKYASQFIKTGIIHLLLNFKIFPEEMNSRKETQRKLFPLDIPDEAINVIFQPITTVT